MTRITIKHKFKGTDYCLAIVDGKIENGYTIERSLLGVKRSFKISELDPFPTGPNDNDVYNRCCVFKFETGCDLLWGLKEGESCTADPAHMENPVKPGSNSNHRKETPKVPDTPLGRLEELLSQLKNQKNKKPIIEKIKNLIELFETASDLKEALKMLKESSDIPQKISCNYFIYMLQKMDLRTDYKEAVSIYNENKNIQKPDSLEELVDFLLHCSAANETETWVDYFQKVSFDKVDEDHKDGYAGLLAFFYLNENKWYRKQIEQLDSGKKWISYIEKIEQKCSNEEIFIDFSMLITKFNNYSILLRKFPPLIVNNFEKENTEFKKLVELYKKYPDKKEDIVNALNKINGNLAEKAKELAKYISTDRTPVFIPETVKAIVDYFDTIDTEEALWNFEEQRLNRLPNDDLDTMLEQVMERMFNSPNIYKYKAAVELALAAENKNKDCREKAKKIYENYANKGDDQKDVLFICTWSLSGKDIKTAASEFINGNKGISDDGIRLNLKWLSSRDEDQKKEEVIYDYMFDSASAAYNEAEIREYLVDKICWYFRAAFKGHRQAYAKYMTYLNAADGSDERRAYLKFVENYHEELEKNDGTLKYVLWLDKAIALKEGVGIKRLPMLAEQLSDRSVNDLLNLYNEAVNENPNSRYCKTIAWLAGEKYLMAFYVKEKNIMNQADYKLFKDSADCRKLFSRFAKWPDKISELPKGENLEAEARKFLSVVWGDYIELKKNMDYFDMEYDADLTQDIPEEYEYAMFYYVLICSLKNKNKLNNCAKKIAESLKPQPKSFEPAGYLLALSKMADGSTKEMRALWNDKVSEEIKCMSGFSYANRVAKVRGGSLPHDEEAVMYFNSLFGNDCYSYEAAKNVYEFFDDIKDEIKPDKNRIKKRPLYKNLPLAIINKIDKL